jgi:hypothetical protein
MRVPGSSKNKFIAFKYVDQAGVALDQRGGKLDNAIQNFVKSVGRAEAFTDLVQYVYV